MTNRKLSNPELNRLTPEEYRIAVKLPVVLVLDNVRSCHNTGSTFRTSDAFRAEKIVLCGISATPPSAEIHKTALGSENTVAWEYFERTEDAVNQLKKNGYIPVAIEQAENSVSLNDFIPCDQHRYALIFGNEVKGVQQSVVDICSFCLEIPQFGTKHSLNVSVSTGIVLWHFFNRMTKI